MFPVVKAIASKLTNRIWQYLIIGKFFWKESCLNNSLVIYVGQKVLIWTLKRFSHLSFDLKGCFRMNIEKVYIEQEPITYGLLIWGISNDMFKIPRTSLEFLLLSFVSTESCVGDKRGKRSKREGQTGWFSKAWARGWVLKESASILRRKTRLERRSPRACVR